MAEQADVHAGVLGPEVLVAGDGHLGREDVLVAVARRAVCEEDPVLEEPIVGELFEESDVGGGQDPPGVVDGIGSGGSDLLGGLAEGVAVVVALDAVDGEPVEVGDDLVGAGAVADEVAHAQVGGDALLGDLREDGSQRSEVRVDVGDDPVTGGEGAHRHRGRGVSAPRLLSRDRDVPPTLRSVQLQGCFGAHGGAPAAAATSAARHDADGADAPDVWRGRELEHVLLTERDAQPASLAVVLVNLDRDGSRCCRPS